MGVTGATGVTGSSGGTGTTDGLSIQLGGPSQPLRVTCRVLCAFCTGDLMLLSLLLGVSSAVLTACVQQHVQGMVSSTGDNRCSLNYGPHGLTAQNTTAQHTA